MFLYRKGSSWQYKKTVLANKYFDLIDLTEAGKFAP
jgi:hypothetical protein